MRVVVVYWGRVWHQLSNFAPYDEPPMKTICGHVVPLRAVFHTNGMVTCKRCVKSGYTESGDQEIEIGG
jgi:hypothetical protein